MQGRKLRGVYVVGANAAAFAVAVGALAALRAGLPVRPSDDPAFASRIVVPGEFRWNIVMLRKSHEGPRTEERDGYELYRESFVSGWNDCLEAFVADWKVRTGGYWSYEPEGPSDLGAPWIIGAPDEINDARRYGWRACEASLKEALKTRSEADLRATLSRSPDALVPAF